MKNIHEYWQALTAFRKGRIENYAEKKGLTFHEAVENLLFLIQMKTDIVALFNTTCDPEFNSINEPKYTDK